MLKLYILSIKNFNFVHSALYIMFFKLYRKCYKNQQPLSFSSSKVVSNDGLILSCWTSVIIRGFLLTLPYLSPFWPSSYHLPIKSMVFGLLVPLMLIVDLRRKFWEDLKNGNFCGRQNSTTRTVSVYLTSAASKPLTSSTQIEEVSEYEPPK